MAFPYHVDLFTSEPPSADTNGNFSCFHIVLIHSFKWYLDPWPKVSGKTAISFPLSFEAFCPDFDILSPHSDRLSPFVTSFLLAECSRKVNFTAQQQIQTFIAAWHDPAC